MLRVYWMCPGVSAMMNFRFGVGEVAVRHVDRDALLPLGPQAVGEQREVDVVLAAFLADPLDRLDLVGEDGLRVVEQAADERALAVVDGPRRREPQDVHFRSSPRASGLPSPPR
jgi:hypothetical protein